MGADQNFDWNQAAASTLEWWRDAGLDTLVDETPRNWLARPVAAPATALSQPGPDAVASPAALPDTLAAFVAWRTGTEAPEAGWLGKAFAGVGDPSADLMIVTDLPEREDAESDQLLSGAAGRLFDRMLAAIGRTRDSVYLVPLCAARPMAGRIAPGIEARLAELLARHIALAAPKRVLLLGNAPSRALLKVDSLRARGRLHALNHKTGTADEPDVETTGGSMMAVASFHPRFLIEQPAKKADAWKDLQMLIGGMQS